MKTLYLVLLTIWLSFAPNFAQAQTHAAQISGLILNNNNKPVDGAAIILLTATDSATVKTTLGNADGRFVLDDVKDGNYHIRITIMGYSNYRSAAISVSKQQNIKLPAIVLTQTSKALKEVAVTAQKNYVEHSVDRTVVNVNALISNTGANAFEVLEKTPGIIVDDNGNISFKGKPGVMVMIDDKPTYLSGENLANYLKSIPASMLDQIELMSNPPAKYDASGNAGVINIKTKKIKAQGFNGVFSASVGNAAYWRTLESLNINYHVNKVNLFANFGYGIGNNYRRLDVTRNYLDAAGNTTSFYTETAFFHPKSYNPNIKVGMDYYVSPKTTIGFAFTGTYSTAHNFNPVYSSIKNSTGGIDSTILAANSTDSKFNNSGLNLNYTHDYDTKGQSLSFDLDYLNYNSNRDQSFVNSTYNNAGVLGSAQNIIDNLPANINIYAAKTDYAQPLNGKGKLEMGLKTSYVNTDNAANYFNVLNGQTTVDNNNTNRFIYKENINAAYMSFTQDWKRFAVKAGLRAENTNVSGHQLGNALSPDSAFMQHYTNLFPTAYFSYKLDTAGSHTLSVSYGKRIDRPYYQDLNPFITILDKYSAFGGNPFLRPQFATEYELTYSYKSAFSISIDHNLIKDYQVENDFQRGDVFFATDVNLGQRSHWGYELYLALTPVKWWNFNLNTELDHNTYSGMLNGYNLNNTTTYLYLNDINQFTFSNGWSAELSLVYISPSRDVQFTHIPRKQVNAGIAKKILNNKATIKLSGRDIFRGNFSGGYIENIPNVIATYHNDNANRALTLGFTYNFGSTDKTVKKHNTSSADSEQGRVRN
jgi:hypothetical protein